MYLPRVRKGTKPKRQWQPHISLFEKVLVKWTPQRHDTGPLNLTESHFGTWWFGPGLQILRETCFFFLKKTKTKKKTYPVNFCHDMGPLACIEGGNLHGTTTELQCLPFLTKKKEQNIVPILALPLLFTDIMTCYKVHWNVKPVQLNPIALSPTDQCERVFL